MIITNQCRGQLLVLNHTEISNFAIEVTVSHNKFNKSGKSANILVCGHNMFV